MDRTAFVICFMMCIVIVPIMVAKEQTPALTVSCLRCLCDASSDCRLDIGCSKGVCGPFQITRPYWNDSGSPTLRGETKSTKNAFENCAKDLECATRSVKGYMTKFNKDCNEDLLINCYDYLAMHHFGGWKCGGKLPFEYENSFNECFQKTQVLGSKSTKETFNL